MAKKKMHLWKWNHVCLPLNGDDLGLGNIIERNWLLLITCLTVLQIWGREESFLEGSVHIEIW